MTPLKHLASTPLAAEWRAQIDAEVRAFPQRMEDGDAEALHRSMHDAKALAATFGYDLIGEIAARLCARLADEPADLSPADLGYLRAGHAALAFVLANDITGDGGDAGREILAKLDELSAE